MIHKDSISLKFCINTAGKQNLARTKFDTSPKNILLFFSAVFFTIEKLRREPQYLQILTVSFLSGQFRSQNNSENMKKKHITYMCTYTT